ncbi:MAG TPA: hypothetical protein PKD54_14525, partial [Pirellulaceae bacterium]|nr:hypothetical protein [Pirellulaceae bacterium]
MESLPVIVVSGLPRSGTSLMMQMLSSGGIPVLTDGLRGQDVSNLRGYFEYEPVKKLAHDASWLPAARGKAVKIILHLLPSIPADISLKVLVMDRPIDEVVTSQFAMLKSMGTEPAATREVLIKTFSKQRETLLSQLQKRPNIESMQVDFHRLVQGDTDLVDAIIRFLGIADVDRAAMLAAVDAKLYRSRGADRAVQPTAARMPWQTGQFDGLIVISVPKSGTNFLSRYLSALTGWPHRWGRPSRDAVSLLGELPAEADPDVARAATHLIQTETDIALLPADERPTLFGNRSLVSLEPPVEGEGQHDPNRVALRHQLIAEHPVRSLPWLLRNPRQCPILTPDEVVREARDMRYGVLFLYRDVRDIACHRRHE